ncbi:hypothetical protein [Dyadobacter bucti]|uniref:hypothetical protein n=1 Tax=Dyadobacter bucti TaxID=2572203 RepID=UPI001107E4C1|nr:hypothetical protein [Dyadobacter bucti]
MSSQNEPNPKKPTHTVYFVRNKEGIEKAEWIKTGVAWEHSDHEGLNLSMDCLGQKVSLTVRKNKPKPE